jgi:transposase-like protein
MSREFEGYVGRFLKITCPRCGSNQIHESDCDYICDKCNCVFTARITKKIVAGSVETND